jgi:hypothetical protein
MLTLCVKGSQRTARSESGYLQFNGRSGFCPHNSVLPEPYVLANPGDCRKQSFDFVLFGR